MSQGSAKSNIGPQGITGATGPTGPIGLTGPAGATGMGIGGIGSTTINFGSAPGTNVVSTVVTGQTNILSTSRAQAFILSDGYTADHNAFEHTILPLNVVFTCGNVVPGVGFTITAITNLRLTGSFAINWIWN